MLTHGHLTNEDRAGGSQHFKPAIFLSVVTLDSEEDLTFGILR